MNLTFIQFCFIIQHFFTYRNVGWLSKQRGYNSENGNNDARGTKKFSSYNRNILNSKIIQNISNTKTGNSNSKCNMNIKSSIRDEIKRKPLQKLPRFSLIAVNEEKILSRYVDYENQPHPFIIE